MENFVPNKFVFVVCGDREHIDTLHFSLKALKKYTKNKIVVITDFSRNEIEINHENVVDVKTPKEYTNHQASIFLKTGLHMFLPKGNRYCYLDTDVVALTTDVDTIFDFYKSPISFSTDHCRIRTFSPYAVNCDCFEQNTKDILEISALEEKYTNTLKVSDPLMIEKQQLLFKKFNSIKKNKWHYLLISVRFLSTLKIFKLDDDTFYHRWKKYWFDKNGEVILYDKPRHYHKLIEQNSKWRWSLVKQRWISTEGVDVFVLQCNHLADYIKSKFGIMVKERNWQHWNGGVFLFDNSSTNFLDEWHKKSVAIFEDPSWKTRDQGTLIANAWQFKLNKHPTLPIEFNFLADYNHPTMIHHGNLNFSFGDSKPLFVPKFIHIYHHWGDEEWQVWRSLEHKLANF